MCIRDRLEADGEFSYAALWAEHTPGTLADEGVNIQAGTDLVGLWISEKDSSTIQIYDDAGGSYDIELRDQSTFGFKSSGGTNTSALSLLHMVKTGTADPSAGGGV